MSWSETRIESGHPECQMSATCVLVTVQNQYSRGERERERVAGTHPNKGVILALFRWQANLRARAKGRQLNRAAIRRAFRGISRGALLEVFTLPGR